MPAGFSFFISFFLPQISGETGPSSASSTVENLVKGRTITRILTLTLIIELLFSRRKIFRRTETENWTLRTTGTKSRSVHFMSQKEGYMHCWEFPQKGNPIIKTKLKYKSWHFHCFCFVQIPIRCSSREQLLITHYITGLSCRPCMSTSSVYSSFNLLFFFE